MSPKSIEPADLRSQAEARVTQAPISLVNPQPGENLLHELLHELKVHQIELEMQNEELRRAQISLEESRDSYADLYEFAPVGYLTLTRNGLIVEANLTGAALLGVDRKKLLMRRFAGFILPQDGDRWYHHFQEVLHSDGLRSCELGLKHADGSDFYARLDCLHSENKGESTVRITIADITEKKRAEEDLRIAAIAFESQEGMIVTDANSVILRINKAFTQLTGYTESEAVGKTPAMLKSGHQDEAFYQKMWGTLKQQNYWQGEMWDKRKDGNTYPTWMTITSVPSPDGITTHYVGTFYDITKNKEAEAEINQLAYYDPLTQLPNRRLLYDRMAQALAGCKRNKHFGAILFLDLDNFKTLNDTHGHDVGDLLLIEVARRMSDVMRAGDTIARLGGDEFVLLLENLSEDVLEAAIQARMVGDKMLEATALPYLLRKVEFSCTTSIGISMFGNQEQSVDDLFKQADLAMYQAKKYGRNNLRFFDPAMQAALEEYSALESSLRRALERRQLSLHYQIQINSAGHAIGAEALLRWHHPERGLVTPAQFIPLAEETGLIVPIGLWVLNSACAQIKKWSANPHTRELQLAINVSARQFRQVDFVEQVQQALSASGINPARLKIELTESLVLDNVDEVITKMHALKALGISFSMDDFGTGYSSLSYLKQLPLSQLKIDQSFVRDIVSDPNDAAIVQAIITMGGAFGLNVIAEGVETEAQHQFLNQQGCHAFQGYLFGKPMPLEAFESLILQLA
jgi:diguanylate cyclase (GGDEF)-like protein/PAS domain S-box-containing protein